MRFPFDLIRDPLKCRSIVACGASCHVGLPYQKEQKRGHEQARADEEKFKTFRETTAAQNILHYVKDIKMHPDPQFPKMSFSRVHQKRRIVGDTHRANYTPGIWKQTQFEGASVGCAASHKVVSALGQFETADPCYIGIIEGDIQIFEEAGTIINAAWDAFIRP